MDLQKERWPLADRMDTENIEPEEHRTRSGLRVCEPPYYYGSLPNLTELFDLNLALDENCNFLS